MGLWKAWFDIRQRFILCFILVTLLMAPQTVGVAIASAHAASAAEVAGATVEPGSQEEAQAFLTMVEGWIGGNAHSIFAVLAVVLAVGGILSHGNARSNLMTLSLPARRGRWLGAQAAMAALLLLGLVIWEGSIMLFTAWASGLDIPEGRVFLAILLTAAVAALWIWPALLFTALTRDAIRAALITISVMIALETALRVTGQDQLGFRHLANLPAWTSGAIPWPPLLFGLVFAGGSALLARRMFQRMEF